VFALVALHCSVKTTLALPVLAICTKKASPLCIMLGCVDEVCGD